AASAEAFGTTGSAARAAEARPSAAQATARMREDFFIDWIILTGRGFFWKARRSEACLETHALQTRAPRPAVKLGRDRPAGRDAKKRGIRSPRPSGVRASRALSVRRPRIGSQS